jgi:GT2 family glycosyltransferase
MLTAVLDMGVGRAVVVDNGSAPESATELQRLAAQSENRLCVLRLPLNQGSAIGYGNGLELASETLPRFIWMLDDDNMPRADALTKLLAAYIALDSDPRNALLSLRPDRREFVDATRSGRTVSVRANSFLDFHLERVLLPGARWRARGGKRPSRDCFPIVPVDFAPYGGFFFNTEMLDRVGLPEPEFELYGDDHEFSHRWIRCGGRIYLCATSLVQDLETSWNRRSGAGHRFLAPNSDERKIYLSVRNRVAWELSVWVSRPWMYRINRLVYLSALFAKGLFSRGGLRHTVRRLRLIRGATQAGQLLALTLNRKERAQC